MVMRGGRHRRLRALQDLAFELSGAGRVDEALATLTEALVQAGSLRWGVAPLAVADVHHDRACVLQGAGRLEEAVAAARESIAVRRGSGHADADQTSRLSNTLELLANVLSDLRREGEADAISAEVLAMRRRAPWPDRARALLNRSGTLLQAGRPVEGLAVVTELMEGALARPEGSGVSDPAFIEGLANLAVLLRMNGRWGAALEVQAVAVREIRALAGTGDDSLASLATALANQGNMHVESGSPELADPPSSEALALREQLASRSSAHLPALADSLNNHAMVLDKLGRADEAEALAGRCVEIRRGLHRQLPAAYERRLGNALGTHAHMLTACDRAEEGVVVGSEAVERLRRLAESDAAAHGPWLAHALDTLAGAHAGAGSPLLALECSREAVAQARAALAVDRSAFAASHADILLACAERSVDQARPEARGWAQEAVELLTDLSGDEPDAFAPALARGHEVLAAMDDRAD